MRRYKTLFIIAVLLTVVGLPAVALALQVSVGTVGDTSDPNDFLRLFGSFTPLTASADVPDCSIPAGQTSCQVQADITSGTFGNFMIFPGAVATATKTSGSVNKVTVSNLIIQWLGSDPAPTVGVLFFHPFAGVDVTVRRAYGQAASGTFCRPDASGNCQVASTDTVLLNSVVVYLKNNGDASFNQVPKSGPYTVQAGGVSNNNYFPQSVLPSTTSTFQCPFSGACQSVELIGSILTFQFNQQFDAVIQKATHTDLSGPNEAEVQNALNAEAVEIDHQPIYDPNNNDVNLTSNGQRKVALLSQVDGSTTIFDPNTVDPTTVLYSAGGGDGVPPVSTSFDGDLNGDGIADVIFSFRLPDILAAGGDCNPPVGVLTGIGTFSSTYTTTERHGNTVTTTEHTLTQDLPFSGQQAFTCSPSAGF